MECNGKAMRLVTGALHQIQPLRVARQHNTFAHHRNEKLFVFLCETGKWDVVDAKFQEYLQRSAQVPFAAVYEHKVRLYAPRTASICLPVRGRG